MTAPKCIAGPFSTWSQSSRDWFCRRSKGSTGELWKVGIGATPRWDTQGLTLLACEQFFSSTSHCCSPPSLALEKFDTPSE